MKTLTTLGLPYNTAWCETG